MVDTLARSDQDIDANLATLSKSGRFWLLTVAAVDVLLVIASMVALNAALPDIALQTAATQTQLTWIVDGYTLVLACLLLPAGAIGDRYGRRGALLVGLAIFAIASLAPTIFDSPMQIIVARAVAGVGRRVHHARDAVAADRRVPEERAQQGRWHLGRRREFRSDRRVHGYRVAAALLLVAVHLLRRSRPRASACSSARARSRRRATKPPHRSTGSARCSSAPPSPFSCSASSRRRSADGRIRSSGAACRPVSRSPASSRSSNCGASIRCWMFGCSATRFRHRFGRHHVPVLRQLRILLRRHAVHAARSWATARYRRRSRSGRWRCRSWFSARRCTCIFPRWACGWWWRSACS